MSAIFNNTSKSTNSITSPISCVDAINRADKSRLFRIFIKSKRFYKQLNKDISKVTYQDIFRYGFNIHMVQYGKILKAENYDKFFPSDETLKSIQEKLINIDIRNAIIYASVETRINVIGDVYAKLIDKELRDSIGAVYTPDVTVDFMVSLAWSYLERFRGTKVVENACGSGHFYRQIYRMYVDEVAEDYRAAGREPDYRQAHSEALEHVLGRDIDPFAIQLTILGVFLEQLKDNVKALTITGRGRSKVWKANYYIDCQNSLDPITVNPDHYFSFPDYFETLDIENPKSLLNSCNKALNPDLIIGNPPYGVKVVKGVHYDDIYNLQSKDSYGYFIANAILRLSEGKRVVFIISSSFLTIKSHFKLRKLILDTCKIIRVVKLHRSTFPSIDIFPVIIELEKDSSEEKRNEHFYHFYDLWQLHPVNDRQELRDIYDHILQDLPASDPWPFDRKKANRYKNRQGTIHLYSQKTIFDGFPSLYRYLEDIDPTTDSTVMLFNSETESEVELRGKLTNEVLVIKLRKIADARQGLIPPSTRDYYRIASAVKGGAVKGGYIEVDENLVLSAAEVEALSADQKEDGIDIDDPEHEKHFVPLDKTGLSDIEGKILSQYYRPVEFFVNWSSTAVHEMKTDSRGRFQNSAFYFRKGISYSDTGIYNPTFRLSHGGVFDQKASFIYSVYFTREYLLGILCSKLAKYFVKVFINHSISAQVDSIKEIPIAIPTDQQRQQIENKVSEIFSQQRENPEYDYHTEQQELDEMVYQLYNLNESKIQEVEDWYDRRYAKLRRDIDTEDLEKG